jgi:HD-like signal output (HDOD) protein
MRDSTVSFADVSRSAIDGRKRWPVGENSPPGCLAIRADWGQTRMKRILFVDDEVAVLDGLRDRLRKHRHEWEMVFAVGAAVALAECERGPFDVVVTDMRMPGMDGAALLHRIKETYPKTVRIVLSGHAEKQAVMRALLVAHQYISKPCDSEIMRSVLGRACALQTLMNDETIRSLVGRVERLPSVSSIYLDLTAVLARSAPSLDDVVHVVERDPAMCLKLLQVVNSAFFGLSRRVAAMRDAIAYLGIELVKSLVLAAQIFAAADGAQGIDRSELAAIQRHSMLVARVARKIAATHDEDAFMAGMLHDVGKIVLALADRGSLAAIPAAARERGVPTRVLEREKLGVTHAEVGAYILGTWGVPFGIVEAVACHHEPRIMGSPRVDATMAVHVAEALVTESDAPDIVEGSLLDHEYLRGLGVLGQVPTWRESVKQLRLETGE